MSRGTQRVRKGTRGVAGVLGRRRGRPRVRVCGCVIVLGYAHRSAAGVTWTTRTTSAQWAARYGHTSVIDAAGAIYVLGGFNGGTTFQDVWVSTDGGARAGLRRGGGDRGVHLGYYRGTTGTTGATTVGTSVGTKGY